PEPQEKRKSAPASGANAVTRAVIELFELPTVARNTNANHSYLQVSGGRLAGPWLAPPPAMARWGKRVFRRGLLVRRCLRNAHWRVSSVVGVALWIYRGGSTGGVSGARSGERLGHPSPPIISKLSKLTGVPYDEKLGLACDARYETVPGLVFRAKRVGGHHDRIDLPSQLLARRYKRLDHLFERS